MITVSAILGFIGGWCLLLPFGAIPCGPPCVPDGPWPLLGAFLGAPLGGLTAFATLLTLPLQCGILALPCGHAVQGMFTGLGDMMSGCCGALAI